MPFQKLTLPLLISAVLAMPVSSAADENALPTLVVSASRSDAVNMPHASSVKVISREEIELTGAKSLPELLRGQPGIYVSDFFGDGSNASIDMRGFGSTANANTLIMVDGRKLNFSTDSGTLYFNSIDLDNVEQVEIIQGSSGILFGNMAVGGVINVITREPVDNTVEAQLEVGSYNSHKEWLRFENLYDNGWSSRVIVSNRESDNYRDHNEAETQSASLRLDKKIKDGNLFVEYEYLDDFIETPGSLFLDEIEQDRRQSIAVYQNDYQDLETSLVRVGLSQSLNDNTEFKMEMAYRDDDRDFLSSFRAFGSSVSTQDRKVLDITPRVIFGSEGLNVTTGLDYQTTDYDLLTGFGPQSNQQKLLSYYLHFSKKITSDYLLLGGIRYAEVENDIFNGASNQVNDDVTIGSVSLNYDNHEGYRFYLKADQNYRFAKVDEHTNPIWGQPVGLENQTGITYELGSDFDGGDYSISMALSRLDLDNEISFDASGFSNVNLDQTTRQGMTIFADWNISNSDIVGINYDYVDSEITSGPFKGNDIPQVPENKLTVYWETFPLEKISARFSGKYVSNQYYGGDYQNAFSKMDSYTTFDLSGRYELENWLVNLRLNNIFDAEYSEAGAVGLDSLFTPRPAEFTSPERNIWLGVKYNFSD